MDLRNWESHITTGAPVVGATVEVREASLSHPNGGAVISSTTTDANGKWEFAGLSETPKDVKVTYLGGTWWYKGLSKHSMDYLYINNPPYLPISLMRNGGLEEWAFGNGPFNVLTSEGEFANGWFGILGTGSSGTVAKETSIVAGAASATSAKFIYTHSSGLLSIRNKAAQALANNARGKDLTLVAQVRQSVGSVVRLVLDDGVGTTTGATSSTTGSFVTLSVTRTINAAATKLWAIIEVTGSATVYIDNVALAIGSTIPAFGPSPFDGGGSDADTLDGHDTSYFLARANHTGTQAPATISPQGTTSGLDADMVDGAHAGNASGQVPLNNGTLNVNLNADKVDGLDASAMSLVGHTHPSGPGSGLDADTLDGVQGSGYSLTNHVHGTVTNFGPITLVTAVWDPASFNNDEFVSVDVTATGVTTSDGVVSVSYTSMSSSGDNVLTLHAVIQANDLVKVRIRNWGGGARDLPSGTIRIWIVDAP